MTITDRRAVAVTGCVGLGCALVLAWVALRPAAARAKRQEAAALPFPVVGNTVVQGFPARTFRPEEPTASDSAWVVEWEITQPGNGMGSYRPPSSVLKINSAKFMYKDRYRRPRWVTVVQNLEVGEVFVPYDPGSPRFRDVTNFAFRIQPADRKLLGPSCVAPGEILGSADPRQANKVYKEMHDDGVRWLANDGWGNRADTGRRGEKMQLWCVFNGANYRYIFDYAFSDEGSLHVRMGATANNFYNRRADGGDVHLHVGCWSFEPDLGDPTNPTNGGPAANVVQLVRRLPQTIREPGSVPDGRYRVDVRPYGTPPGTALGNPALEGPADWVAEEFTTVRFESAVRKNGNPTPQPTGYDLLPSRAGAVRHFPPELEAVNRDFWVAGESSAPVRFFEVARSLPTPPRPIDRKPVTAYHNAAMLHAPRAEDFGPDGVSSSPHVALTGWVGFTLRPRNLFDSTPLFAPTPEPES